MTNDEFKAEIISEIDGLENRFLWHSLSKTTQNLFKAVKQQASTDSDWVAKLLTAFNQQ